MALTPIPVPGKAKSKDLCAAFIAGAPKDAEGYVLYGVVHENKALYYEARASKKDIYYIDNAYFDCTRGAEFRITKNAFQLTGAREHKSDGKRFDELGLTLKPWGGYRTGHWVFVQQSPIFMYLSARDSDWLKRQQQALKDHREVRERKWSRDKLKAQATLPEDLRFAYKLVAHSSAAAVTAAIHGVPSVVSEMSALHGMQGEERLHFLRVLADNQFSVLQMRSGEAWRWLNRSK